MRKQLNNKKGFTLIELLTVIAIISILSAILVPTISQFRTLAKKTSDVNDLRQILQASQTFATQNGEKFVGSAQTVTAAGITQIAPASGGAPGNNTLLEVAAVLALAGDLNDPATWVSANSPSDVPAGAIVTGAAGTYAVNVNIRSGDLSFDYVTDISTWMPSTTPVVFTHMTSTAGAIWDISDVYQAEGGHIAFLGGNVSWYDNLTTKLVDSGGIATSSINNAIGTGTIRVATGL